MKLTKLRSPLIVTILALILSGCGLTAPKGNAGYADLDAMNWRETDTSMRLSIGPTLLRFAARHTDDDPETQALLQSLDGVRVRVYDINGDAERVAADLNRMSAKLQEQEWEPVVLVRESGECAYVLMKLSSGNIAGLTVLASDGTEVVMVNVMGDLEPALFSQTMAALDVSVPTVEIAADKHQ